MEELNSLQKTIPNQQKMNPPLKITLRALAAIVVLTLLFNLIPWRVENVNSQGHIVRTSIEFRTVFDAPDGSSARVKIAFDVLLVEWILFAGVAAAGYRIFRKP